MPEGRSHRLLFAWLKYAISIGLLAFLFTRAQQSGLFQNVADQPKDWRLLAIASLCLASSVLLSVLRWYLLVRALDLPFRVRDAVRLGFLGYFLNFFSLGSVGGDLFKVVFLAMEHPGQRAEAVATVIADRAIGLYALFLVASASILLMGFGLHAAAHEPSRILARGTLALTAVATVALTVLLWHHLAPARWLRWLGSVRFVGPLVLRMLAAVHAYRRRGWTLLTCLLMSLVIHSLSTVGVYLISCGLPGGSPTLHDHFLIWPLSMQASMVPLPGGLGALEGAMRYLYDHAPSGVHVAENKGLIVALCYRVVTLALAAVGLVYYLANPKQVSTVIQSEQADRSGE